MTQNASDSWLPDQPYQCLLCHPILLLDSAQPLPLVPLAPAFTFKLTNGAGWRWCSNEIIVSFLLLTLMNIFMWYAAHSKEAGGNNLIILFFLFLPGVLIQTALLPWVFNHTTVRLQNGRVEVCHGPLPYFMGPLPWHGDLEFPLSELVGMRLEERKVVYRDQKGGRRFVTLYDLMAIGTSVDRFLFCGLRTRAEATYLRCYLHHEVNAWRQKQGAMGD